MGILILKRPLPSSPPPPPRFAHGTIYYLFFPTPLHLFKKNKTNVFSKSIRPQYIKKEAITHTTISEKNKNRKRDIENKGKIKKDHETISTLCFEGYQNNDRDLLNKCTQLQICRVILILIGDKARPSSD